MDGQYLAFVDELGRDIDGNYTYRLDFTEDKEVVWGDYFNVVPAVIVPDIQPDINCLSYQAKFKSPVRLIVAKRNTCFSMQDCIDGIIDMCFAEDAEPTIDIDGELFHLKFGEDFDIVEQMLTAAEMPMFDLTEVKKGDESEIDNLIEHLGDEDEDDTDLDDY